MEYLLQSCKPLANPTPSAWEPVPRHPSPYSGRRKPLPPFTATISCSRTMSLDPQPTRQSQGRSHAAPPTPPVQATNLYPRPIPIDNRQAAIPRPHAAALKTRFAFPTAGYVISSPPPGTPRPPGLWVLYFSFAGVPVFGLANSYWTRKTAVAGASASCCSSLTFRRRWASCCSRAFSACAGICASAMVMPAAMAGAWVSTGLALIVGVLFLALLLPRPATPYSLAAFVTKLGSSAQKAPQHAPETS